MDQMSGLDAHEAPSEQIGGGRYVSPPPVQTPTKLRTHIKPTLRDSGLVKNAQDRRAKLLPENAYEGSHVNPWDQSHAADLHQLAQGAPGQWDPHMSQQELPSVPLQGSQGLYGDFPRRSVSREPHRPQQELPSVPLQGSRGLYGDFPRRSVSREPHRHPSGPREPPVPPNIQPDAVLPLFPQPPGMYNVPPLQPELNSAIDFGQGSHPSSSSGGMPQPITPDTYNFSGLDASWGPADAASGDFNADQFGASNLHLADVPETRITPPTPAKTTLQPSLGARTAAQDVFQDNGDEAESSGAALVGRRTDEVNTLLDEQFKIIDDLFNDLAAKTGLPLQQISHVYHKARGRIHSAFNHWNVYGRYLKVNRKQELQRLGEAAAPPDNAQITPMIRGECYKAFQLAYPDAWQDILETFEESEMTMAGPQTVSQRTQDFGKVWRKVTSTMDSAAAKHGFEAAFIICGKVVNQDASLGHIHTTPGAEDFWMTRCRVDEDTMIGHLKAHVYNLASLAVANDMHADDASGTKEDEPARKRTSSKVATEATKDEPEVLEVPDSDVDDWRLQADHLQCIKGGIIALVKELGGKLTIRSGHFPWKKLHGDLDRQGFVMEGYPEDVLMPGETRSTIRSKGINDLDKREQVILTEALKSGTLVIKLRARGTADPKEKSQSHAVIMGEAPPPTSIHSRGRRLLANGVVDREGLLRLRPSTAATKVKKGRQPAPLPTPIAVDDTPPSTIVRQKNLKLSVEIPPARPFHVVRPPKSRATPTPSSIITIDDSVKESSRSDEDDSEGDEATDSDYEETRESRKRKAKTAGGDRNKRRAPSSDIELIESPKGKSRAKGKGKAPGPARFSQKVKTSVPKGAPKRSRRPRYRTVTSNSEGEEERDEAMEDLSGTHKPLRLRDGPVNPLEEVKERPKPKKVLPGSTVAAAQSAYYEGGMIHAREAYEGPQTGGGSGAASGTREPPMSNDKSQEADNLPSMPSSPSPMSREPLPPPVPPPSVLPPPDQHGPVPPPSVLPPRNQRGPALPTNLQQYAHGRALPAPSYYRQHLEVPQGQRYPVYSHLAPHHAAHDTHAPTHQHYPEVYNTRAPSRAPAQQQHTNATCLPVAQAQQHAETYDARPVPQQHADTYETRVPAPQQGHAYMGYRDDRVAYPGGDREGTRPMSYHHQDLAPRHNGLDMHEGWQPPYGYPAENVRTPRSSPRMSPLPALMEYSSSPPQSEGN